MEMSGRRLASRPAADAWGARPEPTPAGAITAVLSDPLRREQRRIGPAPGSIGWQNKI